MILQTRKSARVPRKSVRICPYCRSVESSNTFQPCQTCIAIKRERKRKANKVSAISAKEKMIPKARGKQMGAPMRKRVEDIIKSFHGRKSKWNIPQYDGVTCLFESTVYTALSPHTSATRSFAIIPIPEIDHKLRTFMVATRLKKEGHFHINPADNVHPKRREPTRYTRLLRCLCKNHAALPMEPVNLQTQKTKDLSAWITKKGKTAEDASVTAGGCLGVITITAEDDHSHPFGILGQRITVQVTHPS